MTLTYRQLLLWLARDAEKRADHELDMPVVMRVTDEENNEWLVGGLMSIDVDAGCTDDDALVLDGSCDTENLEFVEQPHRDALVNAAIDLVDFIDGDDADFRGIERRINDIKKIVKRKKTP